MIPILVEGGLFHKGKFCHCNARQRESKQEMHKKLLQCPYYFWGKQKLLQSRESKERGNYTSLKTKAFNIVQQFLRLIIGKGGQHLKTNPMIILRFLHFCGFRRRQGQFLWGRHSFLQNWVTLRNRLNFLHFQCTVSKLLCVYFSLKLLFSLYSQKANKLTHFTTLQQPQPPICRR